MTAGEWTGPAASATSTGPAGVARETGQDHG